MSAGSDGSPPPPAASKAQQPRSSLYANLLNSDSSQSISRAPVLFSHQTPQEAQQQADLAAIKNAALRFQPTRRPLPAQKTKTKHALPKATPPTLPQQTSTETLDRLGAPVRTTLADWTVDDDDGYNDFFHNAAEKRQRGGRKKRKKNKETAQVTQDWDDIYDPSRPNNYDDYRRSEEKWREIRDWKDRLYAHRLHARRASSDTTNDSDHLAGRNVNSNFAPPSDYSFAPPPVSDVDDGQTDTPSAAREDVPPPPVAHIYNDATGEDAYARRMRMSQPSPAAQHQVQEAVPPPPPPPPPAEEPPSSVVEAQGIGSISRAPVRYQLPEAPSNIPSTEAELAKAMEAEEDEEDYEPEEHLPNNPGADPAGEDNPRSNRPGQRGFAERLMSKYGWTKGSGLGASGTGIVNPLRVQVEKRKKKSDAEGGGFVGPAGKGKIIASKTGKPKEKETQQNENQQDDGPGILSELVVLKGMVDGLDLDFELGEGNLMQEIGDECTEKYGNVERVFIDRDSRSASIPVFVKFTSPLSALRAVQALQGRIFNGNPIQARYFDPEKFEAGIYE